jgi:hypothetical protein
VKVLLVVVDAASPRVFCPAVQTGRLKHLNRLADAGEMHQASISIFPSITPAATASIITGEYPAGHGIVGAAWYEEERDQVAYYGDDLWVIGAQGFGAFLRDFLVHLNGDRLVAPTLFEQVEQQGLKAASLNYLVHRGLEQHHVNVPWLLAVLPGVPLVETVKGPSTLCLGDFVAHAEGRSKPKGEHGAMHRFGMDDAGTAALLCDMVAKGLPDFTVAYFPDNDYRSHEVGPHASLPVLDRVDAALGAMFDAAGGLEQLLSDTCVIVTSDHGHCEIGADATGCVISLDEVLGDFSQAKLGLPWREGDEILICPNMRAAQVYVRDKTAIERVARAALADDRIDLITWRTRSDGGASRYHVIGPRGEMAFSRERGEGCRSRDAFGTTWHWSGDCEALRLDVGDGSVESSYYPNAFERLAGALEADAGADLWVTARPGCEFEVRGGKPHVAGASHGALYALDSLSPVICANGPVRLPRVMRSIDIAALCMRALGLTPAHDIGTPR